MKSPNEVSVLREIYGVGFFLIGVSAPRAVRLQNLIDRNFPKDEANRLLDKDADEEAASGQKTRDTFELADAFIHMGSNGDGAKDKIFRIVDLLMSCPYHPPTLEEHAMFMAYAAAIRSGDLSRQVGAVVTNRRGDVIASGANDAPAKGASHWPVDLNFVEEPEPGAGPDYLRGYDSNERERNKILAAVIEALVPSEATGRVPNSEERRAKRAGQEVQGPPAIVWHSRSHRVRAGGPRRNGGADVIIAAGISKVIYIEPYPKSKAKQLYDDSICLPDDADWGDARREDDKYVLFVPFEGVGPRRFIDLFSLSLGSGRTIIRKKRDADGARIEWRRGRDPRRDCPWIRDPISSVRTLAQKSLDRGCKGMTWNRVGSGAHMTRAHNTNKAMNLAEILEAAAFAEKRVDSWPEWKRELSFWSVSSPPATTRTGASQPADSDRSR